MNKYIPIGLIAVLAVVAGVGATQIQGNLFSNDTITDNNSVQSNSSNGLTNDTVNNKTGENMDENAQSTPNELDKINPTNEGSNAGETKSNSPVPGSLDENGTPITTNPKPNPVQPTN